VFISQPKGPALNQLNLVVEALGHPVGVAMPNVACNRFKPPAERPRHDLERFQRTLTRPLNEFPKRGTSWFVIFTLEPLTQVLHPVNHFTQLRKTPTPLSPRDQLVHFELIGQLQPPFAKLFELFGFLRLKLFLHRPQHPIERPDRLLDHMEPVNHLNLIAEDLAD